MTKKMTKTQRQAIKARNLGYQWIASVVKQCYTTYYLHIVDIDIIANGQPWPAAPIGVEGYPLGQIHRPEHTISRVDMLALD